jgi:hypothetical protein
MIWEFQIERLRYIIHVKICVNGKYCDIHIYRLKYLISGILKRRYTDTGYRHKKIETVLPDDPGSVFL